jgi:hypothetical protein
MWSFLPEALSSVHDMPLLRRCAGPDAFEDVMSVESTILRFRPLLELH